MLSGRGRLHVAGNHRQIERRYLVEVLISCGPLVILTSFVTPPPSRAAGRLLKWRRQNIVRKLLRGQRVAKCMRYMAPAGSGTVDVVFAPDHAKAHYKGLMHCGSVWVCPVCAAKITERRRQELAGLLEGSKYHLVMGTFTFQHSKGDGLRELRDYLNDAYRRVIRGNPWKRIVERFGIVGYVAGLEVTHGEHGWHPHKHVLYVLDKELGAGEVQDFEARVSVRFERFLCKMGRYASNRHGVRFQAGNDLLARYVSKWGAIEELTKAPVKAGKGGLSPWELLDVYQSGVAGAGILFKEYAKAMKGSKQLTWSSGLRAILGAGKEQTDEELAELEEEEGRLLVSLDRDQWESVCRLGVRGMLLEVASSGDRQLVVTYLGAMGVSGFT